MGGGSSIDREKEFDPPLKLPRIQENSLQSTEHVKERLSPIPQQERISPILQQERISPTLPQETQLKWPLPKKEQEKDFVPNQDIDKQRYTLLKNQYERGLPTFRRSIIATSIKFPYVQKAEKKESNYAESNVFKSAHVQMTMKTTTNLWAGITPSVEMRNLLTRLNVAHIESNENVQHRLQGLSKEAERVLGVIIDETTKEQNRLLQYAQEIQQRLQVLHREWLEKYIVELDRWQSIELDKLHQKLEISKISINDTFQKKLILVNEQVKSGQSQIFREEEEKQAKEANQIVSDVTKISQQNKMQHIGTEANTDILLKIRANAGTKEVVRKNQTFYEPYYEYLDQEHEDNV